MYSVWCFLMSSHKGMKTKSRIRQKLKSLSDWVQSLLWLIEPNLGKQNYPWKICICKKMEIEETRGVTNVFFLLLVPFHQFSEYHSFRKKICYMLRLVTWKSWTSHWRDAQLVKIKVAKVASLRLSHHPNQVTIYCLISLPQAVTGYSVKLSFNRNYLLQKISQDWSWSQVYPLHIQKLSLLCTAFQGVLTVSME